MTINPDVLQRGINRANSLTLAVREYPDMALRYTGNVLEQNHLLTPELTDTGLREAQIMYPPIIMMHQLIETIDSHPIAGSMMNSLLEPIIAMYLAAVGGELPDQSKLKKLRAKQAHDMKDALTLNTAKRSHLSSINVIYPTI